MSWSPYIPGYGRVGQSGSTSPTSMGTVLKTSFKPNDPAIHKYTKATFKSFMPEWSLWVDTPQGNSQFKIYKKIAYNEVRFSKWNAQWEFGMSLLIAHYFHIANERYALIGGKPTTNMETLLSIGKTKGLISSSSLGEASVSYDFSKTMTENDRNSLFYNKSDYGNVYYLLMINLQGPVLGIVVPGKV